MKRFRHFDQGFGELCKPSGHDNGVPFTAVGTFGCRTCLCLYVEFEDKSSVFIAHMNAQNVPDPALAIDPALAKELALVSLKETKHIEKKKEERKTTDIWTSDTERGERLKELVTKQLISFVGDEKRKTAVKGFVVCPDIDKTDETGEKKANGWWLRSAVQDFFPLIKIDTLFGHGFVAAPGMTTEVLTWDFSAEGNPERESEFYGWKRCDESVVMEEILNRKTLGPWTFYYQDDQWNVRKS